MAFKRRDGFVGSLPQKFADQKLTKCPMCGSSEPNWTTDSKVGMLNRCLFKCSSCEAIISSTVADITGFANTKITSVGLVKALSGKKMKAYFRIDQVGNMQATDQYLKKEFTLDELMQLPNSV